MLSIVVVLFTAVAVAQAPGDRFHRNSIRQDHRTGQLTRPERFELRKDRMRYSHLQRRVHRDGIVNHSERRKLHHRKVHNRREAFRFKHNARRRPI